MVVSLAGEWDIYRREELQNRLAPAYYEREVVFDLTAAKYVTSTLVCELIVAQRLRGERQLPPARLAVRSAFVRRLLAATGLDSVFPIFESVKKAVQTSCDVKAESA